ncbi:gas vesicle protein [Spirillospora sp. NPDC048911]|uniref:gas vesicle protein n=1 Tax=Spirillospora sp. NPDC048911 TaxID=3364527 RepID=UPI00371FFC2D
MTDDLSWTGARSPARSMGMEQRPTANLADLLERILDKGIVIVGDIRVNLLDIELLTIKLRLLVASVDRAKEMGIDWWEHDPSLSSRARKPADGGPSEAELDQQRRILEENERLRERIAALEAGQNDGPAEKKSRSTAKKGGDDQ